MKVIYLHHLEVHRTCRRAKCRCIGILSPRGHANNRLISHPSECRKCENLTTNQAANTITLRLGELRELRIDSSSVGVAHREYTNAGPASCWSSWCNNSHFAIATPQQKHGRDEEKLLQLLSCDHFNWRQHRSLLCS